MTGPVTMRLRVAPWYYTWLDGYLDRVGGDHVDVGLIELMLNAAVEIA